MKCVDLLVWIYANLGSGLHYVFWMCIRYEQRIYIYISDIGTYMKGTNNNIPNNLWLKETRII